MNPIIIRFLADGENVNHILAGDRHWVPQDTKYAEKTAAFIFGRGQPDFLFCRI